MEIIYKKGDILNTTDKIIVHQVNTKGVMGSGLAKTLRKKYDGLFEHYQTFLYNNSKSTDYCYDDPLGLCSVYHEDCDYAIVNLYAQETYGKTGLHTDYIAQQNALLHFRTWLIDNDCYWEGLPSFSTVKLGCGLGGGDWNIVKSILQRVFYPINGTINVWEP